MGRLRTRAVHLRSSQNIISDSPTDNKVKREAFSPTNLVSSALESCILIIIAIAAQLRAINIRDTRIEVAKIMENTPIIIS